MKYLEKKNLFIVIGLIALITLGIMFYLKNNKNVNSTSNIIDTQALIHEVSLINDKAVPNELVIKLGDKVQFNTKDDKKHVISQGKGNDYSEHHNHVEVGTTSDSGIFGKDEAYLLNINKTGTYYFHDDLNPNIFISILVY